MVNPRTFFSSRVSRFRSLAGTQRVSRSRSAVQAAAAWSELECARKEAEGRARAREMYIQLEIFGELVRTESCRLSQEQKATCLRLRELCLAKNWKAAVAMQDRAVKVAETAQGRDVGFVYSDLGLAHHSLGNYRKAIEICKRGLSFANEWSNYELEQCSFEIMGYAYQVSEISPFTYNS